jgi:hypothetical protein
MRTKVKIAVKLFHTKAIWFLNGFWTEGAEAESENIWKYTQKFIELDPRKKEGNELGKKILGNSILS